MAETELPSSSSVTSMKRKIDEAFDALDDALKPNSDRPSTPKRANTSFYGSLAKYGIKTLNKPIVPKLPYTPTLSTLLSRSRSKKERKPIGIPESWKAVSATPDYSPSSTEAFLQRLSTFGLSTYSSKPSQIDAVAASLSGWINEGGKDRLCCAICKVAWVVASRDGMTKEAGDALVEKQRRFLVEQHKEGCPWRTRQCDPLVYRIPLQSPTGLAREIKSRAAALESVMDNVSLRHPLSCTQVQSLMHTISSVPDRPVSVQPVDDSSGAGESLEQTHVPSTNSVLTSLFGWSLVPVQPSAFYKTPSAGLTGTHSRASSVPASLVSSRESTPSPVMHGMENRIAASFGNAVDDIESPRTPRTSLPRRETPKQQDVMLHCRMCQRRVGLWAFTAPNAPSQETPSTPRLQRQFDILREHRSYCPYVVKSTPLPSVPSYPLPPPTPRSSFALRRTGTSSSLGDGQTAPSSTFSNLRRTTSLLAGGASSLARIGSPSSAAAALSSASNAQNKNNNLVEGWRAVLSVVLRFGIAERARVRPVSPNSKHPPTAAINEESMSEVTETQDGNDEIHGVAALVDGVKQHGGRQLLNYVRSLLG